MKQKAKATSDAKPAGCKRKALNKKEKLNVTKCLVVLKPEVTTTVSLINVAKQLPTYNPRLKQSCTPVIPSTLNFLSNHLKKTFLMLYEECSTLKENHLQFQTKWQRHCGYLLVDKNF